MVKGGVLLGFYNSRATAMSDYSWFDDAGGAGLIDDRDMLPVRMRVRSGVWRPARVWLEELDGTPFVRYEVPIPQRPESIADSIAPDISRWGWQRIDETDGLLDSFITLERPDEVLRFAEAWGPLYFCRAHYLTDGCLWRSDPLSACSWVPAEPVHLWLREASKARAAVHAAALLDGDPPERVPPALWEAMRCRAGLERGPGSVEGMIDRDRSTWQQDDPEGTYWHLPAGLVADRLFLRTVVNKELGRRPGHPRLTLTGDLRLAIDAGLGALPTAWLLVAQVVSRRQAIYICTGCGHTYTRPLATRAPKAGEGNYCEVCRERYTIGKKLQARRRRRMLRELVAFVAGRVLHDAPDWEGIRAEWNEVHPNAAYTTADDLLGDLRYRTRSYGVNVKAVGHLLGEDLGGPGSEGTGEG